MNKKLIVGLILGFNILLTSCNYPNKIQSTIVYESDSYNRIKNELYNLNTDINIDINESENDINLFITNYLENEDKYLKYIVKSYKIEKSDKNINIRVDYHLTKEELSEVKKYVKTNISNINTSKGDFNTICSVIDTFRGYRYIDSDKAFSTYNLISTNEGVCQAFALLFQEYMNELNIENILIEGKLNNQDHLWNMIKLNGNYYHMDLTGFVLDEYNKSHAEDKNYPYVFASDFQMSDRTWATNKYPRATDTQYMRFNTSGWKNIFNFTTTNVNAIKLPSKITLKQEESATLSYEIIPNSSYAIGVILTSKDENIVDTTVDNELIAKNVGKTKINVSTVDKKFSYDIDIEVLPK